MMMIRLRICYLSHFEYGRKLSGVQLRSACDDFPSWSRWCEMHTVLCCAVVAGDVTDGRCM
jgi:hypothetical protein